MDATEFHDILCQDNLIALKASGVPNDFLDQPYEYHGRDYVPLMTCAYNFSHKCMEYMLSLGCNPNVRNRDRSTPLHVASYSRNSHGVRILLEGGGDPNLQDKWKRTPIFHAAHFGDFGIVKYLINKCDTTIKDKEQNTIYTYKNVSEQMREFIQSLKNAEAETASSDEGQTSS